MSSDLVVMNQLALVTGAGSGIGQAIAVGLAKSGIKVIAAGRSEEKLNRTMGLVQEVGGTAYAIPVDVSSVEEVQRLVDTVLNTFGVPSILVNEAGVHG